ncbi:hypothetical protein AGABI2DRAFT_215207 [Agaricus bisporus var. bisporus H97]|uniref:hypothetical protein n=1 Tax=Agaricus bisporus var. bisporus (strain H97 / ATCC MYA-4626 / FGSC 10389) TaxID=936046 RepID=UPI00029F6891|nr:hypothetical protein AGABI2DRAFT_215207 [Agaricus bisporus var. bisporus H97]EKV51761.1 hypothetical protein AGABI2DRAFT_215207 [Agaricus bisporus var. bisporus H97]
MSIPSALLRSSLPCTRSLYLTGFSLQCSRRQIRRFATHNKSVNLNQQPSYLSHSLDTKHANSSTRHDSVGPFQIGISQQALRSGQKAKKWSELSAGGKVVRTAAQTKNVTVILLGASLAAILIYTITSEMYSNNSPTNLFKDACERIKRNPRVLNYLNGPLTFHNNPPSLVRPRHRNRHVTSQVFVDTYGQEHMILTFYIQGRSEGAAPLAEFGDYEAFVNSMREKLARIPDVTLNQAVVWVMDQAEYAWERTKRTVKYLSGAPVPAPPLPDTSEQVKRIEKPVENNGWKATGIFSSLKGSRGSSNSFLKADNRMFTEGEVHADLIRNSDGYFVFRYLLVDIPNTRDPNPVRVFVERAPSVRDNEPVMRWKAH